jgi:isopentenyldiphosphate isomerase
MLAGQQVHAKEKINLSSAASSILMRASGQLLLRRRSLKAK